MKKVLWIFPIFLLVVACSKDDGNVNEPSEVNQIVKDFPFLKIGNEWDWRGVTVKKIGNSPNSSDYTNVVKLVSQTDTIINSTKYFIFNGSGTAYYVPNMKYAATANGTVSVYTNFSDYDPFSFLDFPLFQRSYSVGNKWSYYYITTDTLPFEREVISINETITVEFPKMDTTITKTFENCIKVRQTIKGVPAEVWEVTYWLRNDVGVIKSEYTNVNVTEGKTTAVIRIMAPNNF